jgi:hypothetical protein
VAEGGRPEPGQPARDPGAAHAGPRSTAAAGPGAGGGQAGGGAQLGRVGLGPAEALGEGPAGLGGHLGEVVFEVLQQQLPVRPGQVGEGGPDRGGVAGDLLCTCAVDGVVHAASSPWVPSSLSMASVNERQVPVEASSSALPASLTA